MKTKTRRSFLRNVFSTIGKALLIVMIPKNLLARSDKIIEGEKPAWMNKKFAYLIDTKKCIGCGNCVRACKRENGVLKSFFRTWVERYIVTDEHHVHVESPNGGYDGFKPKTAVQGKAIKGFFVPKICNHCRNSPCEQVCPVNATYRSPEGVVLIDKKRCIGCGYCVQSCPYGNRYIDPRTKTADKCTWCYHRTRKGLLPACVAACPTGTRNFGDLNEENSEIKKLINSNRVKVLKPELNTEPSCYYVGLDETVR